MGRNRGFKAGGPSGPASDPSTVRPGAGDGAQKIPPDMAKRIGEGMKSGKTLPGPVQSAGPSISIPEHNVRPGVTPGPVHGFGGPPSAPAGSTPTPNGPSVAPGGLSQSPPSTLTGGLGAAGIPAAPAYDHSIEHPFSGGGRGRFGA